MAANWSLDFGEEGGGGLKTLVYIPTFDNVKGKTIHYEKPDTLVLISGSSMDGLGQLFCLQFS